MMLPHSDYHEPGRDPMISGASVQPERQEGVDLLALPLGAVLDVETRHHTYRIENRGDGKVLMTGHPEYCPEPVLVDLHGSIGDGSRFKMWIIGPGMRMEFRHPQFGTVWTSRVREIRHGSVS